MLADDNNFLPLLDELSVTLGIQYLLMPRLLI
jgi:hypothetical protein